MMKSKWEYASENHAIISNLPDDSIDYYCCDNTFEMNQVADKLNDLEVQLTRLQEELKEIKGICPDCKFMTLSKEGYGSTFVEVPGTEGCDKGHYLGQHKCPDFVDRRKELLNQSADQKKEK